MIVTSQALQAATEN